MGLIMGGTILWSLLPRRDAFQVAGVEIDLATQPRLKRLIEEIAGRIQQRIPDKVFLIPDATPSSPSAVEPWGSVGCGSWGSDCR